MNVVGIICEYNPLHFGHASHMSSTKTALGADSAVVCVMSGNYVQRGDFAVFRKHARAETAVLSGADLVIELPVPYVLSSAEGFATAAVYILDKLGICNYLSFGSESGDINRLKDASETIASERAAALLKEGLKKGLSYASAQQEAANAIMGARSDILRSPNNVLGIEYLKALTAIGSQIQPITFLRAGSLRGNEAGYSATALRAKLLAGEQSSSYAPAAAVNVYEREIECGRGPVSMKSCELALLSRLRAAKAYSDLPAATEGIDRRMLRFAKSEATVAGILHSVKTKRYTMSRIRRLLICACLGITAQDAQTPPPYIRVLAMNDIGKGLLQSAQSSAELPIITKPAIGKKLTGHAAVLFQKEVESTDLYVLAYQNEKNRTGGQEWRESPVVVNDMNCSY